MKETKYTVMRYIQLQIARLEIAKFSTVEPKEVSNISDQIFVLRLGRAASRILHKL